MEYHQSNYQSGKVKPKQPQPPFKIGAYNQALVAGKYQAFHQPPPAKICHQQVTAEIHTQPKPTTVKFRKNSHNVRRIPVSSFIIDKKQVQAKKPLAVSQTPTKALIKPVALLCTQTRCHGPEAYHFHTCKKEFRRAPGAIIQSKLAPIGYIQYGNHLQRCLAAPTPAEQSERARRFNELTECRFYECWGICGKHIPECYIGNHYPQTSKANANKQLKHDALSETIKYQILLTEGSRQAELRYQMDQEEIVRYQRQLEKEADQQEGHSQAHHQQMILPASQQARQIAKECFKKIDHEFPHPNSIRYIDVQMAKCRKKREQEKVDALKQHPVGSWQHKVTERLQQISRDLPQPQIEDFKTIFDLIPIQEQDNKREEDKIEVCKEGRKPQEPIIPPPYQPTYEDYKRNLARTLAVYPAINFKEIDAAVAAYKRNPAPFHDKSLQSPSKDWKQGEDEYWDGTIHVPNYRCDDPTCQIEVRLPQGHTGPLCHQNFPTIDGINPYDICNNDYCLGRMKHSEGHMKKECHAVFAPFRILARKRAEEQDIVTIPAETPEVKEMPKPELKEANSPTLPQSQLNVATKGQSPPPTEESISKNETATPLLPQIHQQSR